MGDNFLNKYKSLNTYNANQVNNYNNFNSNSGRHQFEQNDPLAHEILRYIIISQINEPSILLHLNCINIYF
jgi:hypothetical protein